MLFKTMPISLLFKWIVVKTLCIIWIFFLHEDHDLSCTISIEKEYFLPSQEES